MIENDRQLRHSVQAVARMYELYEREIAAPLWDPKTCADVAEGTASLIRRIEREIAEYLAKKYGLTSEKTSADPPDRAA